MPMKPAKRSSKKPVTSAAETAARAERDRLRRLETLHRNLKGMARNVSRYARGWEVERAVTARALLEGSAWGVFERDIVQRVQQDNEHLADEIARLRREIERMAPETSLVTT
jgi:superfamily II RNA helicase